ncbi:MAG TPA: c-type cytochrome domain-containing protein, partial [Planctomycetota bacterium]|nr:c-type cytochrome domain-containing protein [Planctomycetota bacterium]
MTHGRDFLFGPMHAPKKSADTADAAANKGTAIPGTDGTTALTEFQRTIAPILERCCTKCHNPDKKKGELLMTTPEGLQAGGENGAVFVPGKPEESPMLQRCLLPEDHDDHMPPEGKPQPTAAELEALRAWIAAGARFQ